VDGAYFTVIADTTIDNIATQYPRRSLRDYLIRNSNDPCFGDTPDSTLAALAPKLLSPGGTAEQIAWDGRRFERGRPVRDVGQQRRRAKISFGPRRPPEAAGWSIIPAAAGGWVKAAGEATSGWRGFSAISQRRRALSARRARPIMAANGGTVRVSAGWSNWGYGFFSGS